MCPVRGGVIDEGLVLRRFRRRLNAESKLSVVNCHLSSASISRTWLRAYLSGHCPDHHHASRGQGWTNGLGEPLTYVVREKRLLLAHMPRSWMIVGVFIKPFARLTSSTIPVQIWFRSDIPRVCAAFLNATNAIFLNGFEPRVQGLKDDHMECIDCVRKVGRFPTTSSMCRPPVLLMCETT